MLQKLGSQIVSPQTGMADGIWGLTKPPWEIPPQPSAPEVPGPWGFPRSPPQVTVPSFPPHPPAWRGIISGKKPGSCLFACTQPRSSLLNFRKSGHFNSDFSSVLKRCSHGFKQQKLMLVPSPALPLPAQPLQAGMLSQEPPGALGLCQLRRGWPSSTWGCS